MVGDYIGNTKCRKLCVELVFESFFNSIFYTASQKTLFHLKSCMSASFYPDFDFTYAKADEFSDS